MGEPTFYNTVFEERVKELATLDPKELLTLFERPVAILSARMLDIAVKAYAAGLQDGFAQGVAAESKRYAERK